MSESLINDAELDADVRSFLNRIPIDFGIPTWIDLNDQDPRHFVDDKEFFATGIFNYI